MKYSELIAKALNGRSVNSMAKAWGVNQPTLDRYVKGQSMPDFDLAERMIAEAGIDAETGLKILAEEARARRVAKFKLQSGFAQVQTLALLLIGSSLATLYIM